MSDFFVQLNKTLVLFYVFISCLVILLKFFFMDCFNKKYDPIAVMTSAIGNVHHISVETFGLKVNKNAIGKTNTIKRNAEIIKGEYTSLNPC